MKNIHIVREKSTGNLYNQYKSNGSKVYLNELDENFNLTGRKEIVKAEGYFTAYEALTIAIKTTKGAAIEEWMMKEEGSFEDQGREGLHAYSILQNFGGIVYLTVEEALMLLKSADYNTSWNPAEIAGGKKTLNVIAGIAKQIREALAERH